jgi:hypothetical protein
MVEDFAPGTADVVAAQSEAGKIGQADPKQDEANLSDLDYAIADIAKHQ